MDETGTRKCSYILMLVLSMMVAAMIWLSVNGKPEREAVLRYGMELFAEEIMQFARKESSDEPLAEERVDELISSMEPEAFLEGIVTGNLDEMMEEEVFPEPEDIPEPVPEEEPEEEPAVTIRQADVSYFDDALFIGDSRTVGLSEYGGLGNAEVVADTGMSVYKVFNKRFTLRSGEKKKLEELLTERQFGKIYIMLGVNELGYHFEPTVEKYTEMLARIEELQPDAILYLKANLHLGGKKSRSSDVYNNENINRINQAISALADGENRFYLDVNVLYDDEDGNLSDEYTADDAHIYAKYYPQWVEWLLANAVFFE